MKELDVKYHPDEEYRELFSIMIDSYICEETCIGITNAGELLYIENKLMNNSSAYWMQSVIYSISKEEFRAFLKQAESKGYIEKAIQSGKTTKEELSRLSGYYSK